MPRTIANLKKYLEMVPELSSRMLLSYSHLTDGITNESYHLKFSKDEYVLKFFNHQAIDLGVDHKNEMRVMSRVEHLDITPTVIYFDLDEEFSVSRWINGDYWRKADFAQPELIHALVQRIKDLHMTNTDGLHEVDLIERSHCYREKVIEQDRYPELTNDEIVDKIEAIIHASRAEIDDCLCHNDILASNIINQDHIYLLDWEFAGVTCPYFELAVISRGNDLREEHQDLLLRYYFGDTYEQHRGRFNQWQIIYDYVALLWDLSLQESPEDLSKQQKLALSRILNEL